MGKAGRPLKFKTVKELKKRIDAYFADCDPHWTTEDTYVIKRNKQGKKILDKDGQEQYVLKKDVPVRTPQKPYTITGLAVWLETSRETLLDYENGNRDKKPGDEGYDPDVPQFSDTIKAAKQKCQNFAEISLFSGASTGAIFNLKNNYKWLDVSKIEEESKQQVTVITRRHKRK